MLSKTHPVCLILISDDDMFVNHNAAAGVLLITANVGSIFEEPKALISQWMAKVLPATQFCSAYRTLHIFLGILVLPDCESMAG